MIFNQLNTILLTNKTENKKIAYFSDCAYRQAFFSYLNTNTFHRDYS